MCATVSAQEPIFLVDGAMTTLNVVKECAKDIESISVVNDRETLSNYEKMWKMKPNTLTSVVLITTKASVEHDEAWLVVEEMPKFMGGELNTFRNWVMQNLRYPEEAMTKRVEGDVVVQFCVGKDGYIREDMITILESPDKSLSDEVVRVLKSSPQWTAGKQKGENVIVSFTLPVGFKLVEDIEVVTFND